MDTADPPPGYRRRILVIPGTGHSVAALEDDMHCMVVRIDHDGTAITAVHAHTERAPWNVCPTAAQTLAETFTGLPLAAAVAPRAKWSNCTHLYDLAALAAAHAGDAGPTRFDIASGDPVDGVVTSEIRRDGALVHRWQLDGQSLTAPAEIAGLALTGLRDWIATLPPVAAEAARLLQWASLVAHGRQMTNWSRFEAEDMPSNCYAFRPGEPRDHITRTGNRHDFSRGGVEPLDHFDGQALARGRAPPNAY
ncbi:MAG: DUF2889 domain-containing protein [Sphingomonadales bacterium]|nr:DUF2889 domain-containing protein [Sphingomonadales bacterium]